MSNHSDHEADQVEGIDESTSDGWGEYPLDSVFVRTELRSVSEVLKRIEGERYVLDPDFQRDFVWSNQKQSKLIESSIMRIPLPVFYVAEAPDGRIIVVDGLQRLTTFVRFVNGQFRLGGLAKDQINGVTHPLEGRAFSDLSITLQERILDTQLTMYILDAKAPERARLDIFERVNSGEPLTRQQMRNALYNGPATQWLKSAAEGEAFQRATGGSLSAKTMRDREAINRFCAFKLLGYQKYTSGDMDTFLATGLRQLGSLSRAGLLDLRKSFDSSMDLNYDLFGEHAFRKSLGTLSPNRSVMNISLFEVCAVMMATQIESGITMPQKELRSQVLRLMADDGFIRSITYSTNSTAAVQYRFSSMEGAILGAAL